MTNHLASLRYRPSWFTKKAKSASNKAHAQSEDRLMSTNLYISAGKKEEVMKDPFLAKAITWKEELDDCEVSLSDKLNTIWISPRIGNLSEGIDKHMSFGNTSAVMVTREQIKGMLEVSREVANRDKQDFHDPEGFYAYLMKEFQEAEEAIDALPEDTVFFVHQS